MFGFGGEGKKFANAVADDLGIPRDVFDTALLEQGVSWSTWKGIKRQGWSPEDAAANILPTLQMGIASLENKFGPQEELEMAKRLIDVRSGVLRAQGFYTK
ncbi:MAG: hypothetical protein ACO1OG_03085 [Devosia sp.]